MAQGPGWRESRAKLWAAHVCEAWAWACACEGVLAPPSPGAQGPQPVTMETRQGLLEPAALVWISNPMPLSQEQLVKLSK